MTLFSKQNQLSWKQINYKNLSRSTVLKILNNFHWIVHNSFHFNKYLYKNKLRYLIQSSHAVCYFKKDNTWIFQLDASWGWYRDYDWKQYVWHNNRYAWILNKITKMLAGHSNTVHGYYATSSWTCIIIHVAIYIQFHLRSFYWIHNVKSWISM